MANLGDWQRTLEVMDDRVLTALVGSFKEVSTEFGPPGELARLVLEGKRERELYEALGNRLRRHPKLAAQSLEVCLDRKVKGCRSRKRPDIAVYDGNTCVALVEAKMAYAAEMIDAKRPDTYLCSQVREDLGKLRSKAWPECARFALVFLVYSHQTPAAPEGRLQSYGKGRPRLTKQGLCTLSDMEATSAHYGKPEIHAGFGHYLEAWRSDCSALSVASTGNIAAGKAYGTEVTIFYWLLRVPRSD